MKIDRLCCQVHPAFACTDCKIKLCWVCYDAKFKDGTEHGQDYYRSDSWCAINLCYECGLKRDLFEV